MGPLPTLFERPMATRGELPVHKGIPRMIAVPNPHDAAATYVQTASRNRRAEPMIPTSENGP